MSAIETALSGLFARALDTIMPKLELVKVKNQPVDYAYSEVRQIKSIAKRFDVGNPTAKIEPNFNTPISLIDLNINFDDKPSSNYRPRVMIMIDNMRLFDTKTISSDDNPYLNNDLTLKFPTGKKIDQNAIIYIYLWREGTDTAEKKATLSYTLGEY